MLFTKTRFLQTTAYIRDGTLMLDKRKPAEFNLKDAQYYTVVEGDTLDGIAYRVYEDTRLWWAILDANPQFLSEVEIEPGDVLAIPSIDEVRNYT